MKRRQPQPEPFYRQMLRAFLGLPEWISDRTLRTVSDETLNHFKARDNDVLQFARELEEVAK